MKFLSVSQQNFCSIESMEFSLSNRGLVAVVGENRDAEAASSNASGKSTAVVDAICWCLFGKTTKGGTADSVTPGGKGKGTSVSVTFEQGGKTYVATRYRKHKTYGSKLLITVDGVEVSKATADDSDKLLEQILGITYDTFLYTTILGQGLMFRFSQLTDQNRKEILEGIAGANIYEDARIAARESARVIANKKSAAEQILSLHTTRMPAEVQNRDNLLAMEASAVDRYTREIAAADYEIASKQAELDALDKQLAAAPAAPDTSAQDTFRTVESRALTAVMDAGQKVASARTKLGIAEKHLRALSSVGLICDSCGSMMSEAHRAEEGRRRSEAVADAGKEVAAAISLQDSAASMHKRISDQLAQMQHEERNYNLFVNGLKTQRAGVLNTLEQRKLHRSRIVKQDFTSLLAAAEAKVEALAKQTTEKQAEIAAISQELEDVNFWVDGFQDIRIAAIDHLLAFMNVRLAHYMKVLTGDDISVTLSHTDKGKIDLNVKTAGGTYLSASGGEKTKVDIAMAFALHDLAGQCTNWSSNLLVMDEIAVFLDAAGIERLMQLVSEKMDRLDSVFMISHDPVFEGYADSTMRIVKENGVSRLEK